MRPSCPDDGLKHLIVMKQNYKAITKIRTDFT